MLQCTIEAVMLHCNMQLISGASSKRNRLGGCGLRPRGRALGHGRLEHLATKAMLPGRSEAAYQFMTRIRMPGASVSRSGGWSSMTSR